MTEQILDALPDFLSDYKNMTILTQQLFRDVQQLLVETKKKKLAEVGLVLFGKADCTSDLEARLSTVFREQSQTIFNFTEE